MTNVIGTSDGDVHGKRMSGRLRLVGFPVHMRIRVSPPGIGRNTVEDGLVKAAVNAVLDRCRADRAISPAGAAAARQSGNGAPAAPC